MEDEPPPPPPDKKPPSLGLWMLFGVPLFLVFSAFVAWLWILPDLRGGGSSVQLEGCLYNLRELAHGVQMYAADFDDTIPNGTWNEKLYPYLKSAPDEVLLFSCPVQRRINPETSGYALNSAVAGQKMKDVGHESQTILVFDSSDIHHNAVQPITAMASPGRHEHGRKNCVVFLDGSAKPVDAR